MTTQPDLEAEVIEVLSSELNLRIPAPDTDLIAEGILDSFGLVNLMTLLDRRWHVKVSTDKMELDNFRSVDSIAGFISSEQGS